MKKLVVLILVALFAGNLTFAQKQKKPNINKALKLLQNGDIKSAKEEIDRASTNEKYETNGKTWYYRGLIYMAIDTTSNAEYAKLDENPLVVANESFAKADELNKSDSEYTLPPPPGQFVPISKTDQVRTVYNLHLQKGVDLFKEKRNAEAVEEFEKCQLLIAADTTSYYYGGLAAHNGGEYTKAVEYYGKYIDNGGNEAAESVYGYMVSIKQSALKDNEGALKTLDEAMEKYPENVEMVKQKINLYIAMDRIEEAKQSLMNAIKEEPDNSNLHFTLGAMYEELGDVEEAKKSYATAIEKDPNNYNAVFNSAVLYYNEAVEIAKTKNSLGITSADLKKAKELETELKVKLQSALPYWEKANALKAKDRTTLETLQYIYTQMKENDKAEKVYNELQELGEG